MINAKEKTALSPSVGADGGQPDRMTKSSISSFAAKINKLGENTTRSLDNLYRQLHSVAHRQAKGGW